MCTKINKAVKMHHCIGDYRSVHIKMKIDLIYLNVILSIMFEKGFKKKTHAHSSENYFELVLKL